MNEYDEDFDGENAARQLLKKVRGTRKHWAEVYKTLGVPFQFRSPNEQELEAYVRKLARKYKKKPPK